MKRILTIDGGGIKGVFPASFLTSVEDSLGRSVADYFDLIAGTSTGGIIALGLGLGLPAAQILRFYQEHGPAIFRKSLLRYFMSWALLPKYDERPLREALQAVFGNHTLGESKKRLVIYSSNLETGEVYVYKTAHHPRFERDYKERLVDIGLATAAAPTYFPTFRNTFGTPLIDGGVWANNPVGFAAIEATHVLKWPPGSVRVLSLGCTTGLLDVRLARKLPLGRVYWATQVVEVFMALQSSASQSMAQWVLGPDNVDRISPPMPSGRFRLDSIREIESLRGLGDSEARKALPRLRERFFGEPAEEFVTSHH